MSHIWSTFRNVTFFSLMLFFIGCSGEEIRPSSNVHGKVTLDGEPLTDSSIHFTSTRSGESAYVNLDNNGQYSIEFPETDVGTAYDVTVAPVVQEGLDATELAENPRETPQSPAPKRYASRTTSGLKVEGLVPGDNEFNFDLTSK